MQRSKDKLQKLNTVAFREKHPVRIEILHPVKTTCSNCELQHISNLNYPGYDVSYDYSTNIKNKLISFGNICETVHRRLRNKTHKETYEVV